MSRDLPETKAATSKERWFWIASPHAFWRTPLIGWLGLAAVIIFGNWLAVVPWGFNLLFGLWAVVAIPTVGGLIGVVVCPFLLLSKKRRRAAVLGLLTSAACLGGFFSGVVIGEQIRLDAFRKLADRSRPLVTAIKSYETQFGRPPKTLAELTPDFMSAIPKTGLGAYPQYEYVVGEQARRFAGNPWALYVFTPSGGINFDQFLYFPLQNYPAKGFGGWLQRIGDWAYVHE